MLHVVCRTLNRIQSRIYPTAFGSNENVLVSAPTGAGKTNIAMIAVLREVGNNMAGGMIDKVCLGRFAPYTFVDQDFCWDKADNSDTV